MQAASGRVSTPPLQLLLQPATVRIGARALIDIESEAEATASHIGHPVGILLSDLRELLFEVGACLDSIFH